MITVFTPTYNRAHLLPRLYESLCQQTFKDFEWVIVDDGSTEGCFKQFQSPAYFADSTDKISSSLMLIGTHTERNENTLYS